MLLSRVVATSSTPVTEPKIDDLLSAMIEIMASTRLPMVRWEAIFKVLEVRFPKHIGDLLSRMNRDKAGVHVWAKMDADKVTWRFSPRKPEQFRPGIHVIGEWEFGHKSFYYWPIEMPEEFLKSHGLDVKKDSRRAW